MMSPRLVAVSAALDVHQPRVHVELALNQRLPTLLSDQAPRPELRDVRRCHDDMMWSPAIQLPEHGGPVRVGLQPRVYGHGLRHAAEGEAWVIVFPVRVGLLRVLEPSNI